MDGEWYKSAGVKDDGGISGLGHGIPGAFGATIWLRYKEGFGCGGYRWVVGVRGWWVVCRSYPEITLPSPMAFGVRLRRAVDRRRAKAYGVWLATGIRETEKKGKKQN